MMMVSVPAGGERAGLFVSVKWPYEGSKDTQEV